MTLSLIQDKVTFAEVKRWHDKNLLDYNANKDPIAMYGRYFRENLGISK